MARKNTTKTKVSKRTVKKTRPRKVGELQFADGKIEDKQSVATDIEEILSIKSKNPFGTTSEADFENKLGDMNMSQMQELAVKASVFPSGNKTTLKNKLKKEFKTRFGTDGQTKYISQTEEPMLVPESDLAKEVKRILNS